MSAAEGSLLGRLLNRAPVARLRAVVFAAACRLHLVRLDRTRADRAQLRALLGLVHRGRGGRFGRDHDFARIRTADDFRRLVPLSPPGLLPREDDALLAASHRRALTTAFALLAAAAPRAHPLEGRVTCECRPRDHLPALARPSFDDGGRVSCVVEADAVRLPDGRARVALLTLPEAPVAVEDPRLGGLRLLVDHGVYFELVPAARREADAPRLGVAEARPGEAYELAITAPGGWWACRSGLFVAFERLCPPLFRLVEAPAPEDAPNELRRSAGAAETLPELPAPVPWAVPADRV